MWTDRHEPATGSDPGSHHSASGYTDGMNKTQTLEAGLIGWRERFAQKIEKPVSKRTPLTANQVRAIIGALFFLKSALYVARSIRRAIKNR